MKVMIVDDEDLIRMGLEVMVGKLEMGVEIVGSYANGLEALLAVENMQPGDLDVLITDIKMPIMDGIKLTERVKEHMPAVEVFVLSGFDDFEYARQAFRFGIKDYLLKPIDKYRLFEALNAIQTSRLTPDKDVEFPVSGDTPGLHEYSAVDKVIQILEREYGKPFELDQLAAQVGLSPTYISRLFKEKKGETITDYLIHVRISKAKRIMESNPNVRNYEVAGYVGYSDPVYFNKLFKRVTGMTPREYRSAFMAE